jgi:uncharacterized protein (TIRG00374 family)
MLRSLLDKIRLVDIVMALVIVTGMVITGFKFLDAREIGLIFSRLSWWSLVPLLALPVGYLWLKAERYTDLFEVSQAPVTDPEVRRITMASYASAQAATLLPGGYVARIGLMEASLKRGAQAVLPTLLEKVLDLALLLAVGLVACYSFPETQGLAGGIIVTLTVLIAFAVSPGIRRKTRHLAIGLVSKFVKKSVVKAALSGRVPDNPMLIKLAFQTVLVLLSELTILWACFSALGLRADPVVLVLAYGVADVIGRIAPTPGGFGLTEVGMVAFLHQLDGMGTNEAAAATFLFRFLLFLVPAVYGTICYLFLWKPMTSKSPRT